MKRKDRKNREVKKMNGRIDKEKVKRVKESIRRKGRGGKGKERKKGK